ncbi:MULTISPECIES: LysR substrate-binding domain-containing protein [unclassified Cupriavidus]|uniref:LysR substrate-binding domain-containing protein n=1 Tax=unclassified Cupriavidus TaxID=2640874 RepID=UPI001C000207|nr:MULTISPECIES: LysR substrate-binding domain-containing protein [unclassified Cupriavidus]MCA3188481.1 LysR family transcriptional regulator [Cupriavidus sp.]MCA3199471.1 LysR family transcriptional regulator [Cupriavidus sp.]MCA3204510.1 LysR family transcriptional regulator [Cupriavidus sp.]MCA3206022.1 LysR family transcriptional regulator [Cupriavidus sp.]MCA3236100.1 LysR family transcriptional regulator [Cupriavidus sp.]
MSRTNLDLAALRSLLAGIELGSFARAADRVGRSTSAISAQIRKLEEQAGTPLFRKAGRGLALTAAGEAMLGYARRLVELNDEAVSAVRGVDLAGGIRLGLQEEFGEGLLPEVLGRFARAHPKVRIEAVVSRNADLLERIDTGRCDLALVWADMHPAVSDGVAGYAMGHRHVERIDDVPMCWVGPAAGAATVPWQPGDGEPLPLVAFDRPCQFHSAGIAALERAGITWRVTFSSPNLGGLWAAAAAGLGLTVRSRYGLPAGVRALQAGECGLPALPSMSLAMVRAAATMPPEVERLADILRAALPGAPVQDALAA